MKNKWLCLLVILIVVLPAFSQVSRQQKLTYQQYQSEEPIETALLAAHESTGIMYAALYQMLQQAFQVKKDKMREVKTAAASKLNAGRKSISSKKEEIDKKKEAAEEEFVTALTISVSEVVATIAYLNTISLRVTGAKQLDTMILLKANKKMSAINREISQLKQKIYDLKNKKINWRSRADRARITPLAHKIRRYSNALTNHTRNSQRAIAILLPTVQVEKRIITKKDVSKRQAKMIISQQKTKVNRIHQCTKTLKKLALESLPGGLSEKEQKMVLRHQRWLSESTRRLNRLGTRWQSYLKLSGSSTGMAQKEMLEMGLSFKLQYLMNKKSMQVQSQRFAMVANIIKVKHDIAMAAIRNMR